METYKKIPILENYEIDTLGNVRNIKTKRILKDRPMVMIIGRLI